MSKFTESVYYMYYSSTLPPLADQPDVRLSAPIVPHHGPRGDALVDVHQRAGGAGGQPVHVEPGVLVDGGPLGPVLRRQHRDDAVSWGAPLRSAPARATRRRT